MELTQFKPYKVQAISEVFDLHIGHLIHYLHRTSFTEFEYTHRCVPLNWTTLRRFFLKTAFNWSVIGSLFLLTFFPGAVPALQVFNLIFGRALNITKVDMFSSVYVCTFCIIEDASLFSVWKQIHYRNGTLQLLFEFRNKLAQQFSELNRKKVLQYFTFWSYLAGLASKGTLLVLLVFTSKLNLDAVSLFNGGHISALELLIGIAICSATQLLFFEMLFILFTLLTGMFLLLTIFRIKLKVMVVNLALMKRAQCPAIFSHFYRQLMCLNREVRLYNDCIKNYILDLSVGSKFVTTFIVIYMGKQTQPNLFSFLFMAMYIVVYLYDMAAHFKVAIFQTKNRLIYKYLTEYSAKAVAVGGQKGTTKLEASVNWEGYIRLQIKVAYAIEFASNNLIGFSMGKNYLIDKDKVIQSFMLNIYVLILLSKKLNV